MPTKVATPRPFRSSSRMLPLLHPQTLRLLQSRLAVASSLGDLPTTVATPRPFRSSSRMLPLLHPQSLRLLQSRLAVASSLGEMPTKVATPRPFRSSWLREAHVHAHVSLWVSWLHQ